MELELFLLLLFVNQLLFHLQNFQTEIRYTQSFLQLIHVQRGPGCRPLFLSLLLRKDEMATARDRHDCLGVVQTLSRDSLEISAQVSVRLNLSKHLSHLEGKTRMLKSWTEEPEQNSLCVSP